MEKIVPPEGPRNKPRIAIVGEAPGREEELAGRPFVGPSGRLLDQMLAVAGIPRGECYITNVSKVRPPANNFTAAFYENGNRRFPTTRLLDLREQLWKELREVNPSIVITLGAEALAGLGLDYSVGNYRGMMIEHFGLRVLPTFHPSYLLRGMYHERPIVECDLRKAYRQAICPTRPQVFLQPTPSFEDAMRMLRMRPKRVSVDIETVNNVVRCIGFGWSKHEAMSIPLMRGRSNAWTLDEETQLMDAINRLLLDPYTEKVLQNMPYDRTVLARELGLDIRNVVVDTMFAHYLLFPELPKDLGFLCSLYTDHPMYWNYDRSSTESTATYNCMDCVVTFEVAEELEKQLRERGIEKFYKDVLHRSVEKLTYVQSRGMLIDLKAREEVKTQTLGEMGDLRARIERLVGYDVNPSSPKQVSELVYNQWKLPIQKHPKTQKPTTDDDALQILAKKNPHRAPVIQSILDFRQKRVLVGNFCEMELKNNRVFTSYNPGGTVTGRLASSATIDGLGGNLQNIPRGAFRRIFRADEGKILIKADLSQAEYRVLIWKARIDRVIRRWQTEPGFNIHMWNASENIYRIPIEQVTKTQYQNAKNGVYGANYGIGPIKVSRMYNIEYQDAKFIIERYHEAVPEVKQVYQAEIVTEIQNTRKLINPLGRERIFFGRMDDDLYRQAYSHYCQSTVADLINLALCDLTDDGVDVLLQIHDELVIQCDDRPEEIERHIGLMKQRMERPLQIPGVDTPLVIPADIKIGYDWYNTRSVSEWRKEHGLVQA